MTQALFVILISIVFLFKQNSFPILFSEKKKKICVIDSGINKEEFVNKELGVQIIIIIVISLLLYFTFHLLFSLISEQKNEAIIYS